MATLVWPRVYSKDSFRLIALPLLAEAGERSGEFSRFGLEHRLGLGRLGGNDHRHTWFDDPGLFESDLGQRVAQILHMVEGDGHQHAGERPGDHVGRIVTPTEAGFQQQNVSWRAGACQEGGTWRDPEEGNGL